MQTHSAHEKIICTRIIQRKQIGNLYYFLTESMFFKTRKSYAITVSMFCRHGETDWQTAWDFTSRKPFAMRLFQKISRGAVTPSVLLETLSELIEEML